MTGAARRISGAAPRAVVLGMALACTGAGSARLQGQWHGVRAEGVAPEVAASANAFASSLSIDVHGASMTVVQGSHRQSGRYRVARDEASEVVVVTDADGPLEPHTFVLAGDTMRWEILPGKTIVFRR
jgi:hypothetical protein